MNNLIRTEVERLLNAHPKMLFDNTVLMNAINGTFNVQLDVEFTDVETLTEAIDNAVLSHYFTKIWQPQIKKYKYSGLDIIDEVNALNPDLVLDIGCGYNEFRSKIKGSR